MPTTTVINVRDTNDFDPLTNPDDVYIGRRHPRRGWPESPFANPFRVNDQEGEPGSAQARLSQSLVEFEHHLRNSPGLLDQLPSLVGKRLGCWCKPDRCHGDVILAIMRERGLIDG